MKKAIILLVLVQLWACSSKEVKIYEWRGKDRTGIYNESNLLKEWPPEGPVELWSIDNIGNGFVSPVFTEDQFFITGEIDSMTILYCFDLDGKIVWQTTIGKEWMKTFPGARSAATIVDDLIYVGSGMGNLFCIKRNSGEIVWSKDLEQDFAGVLPMHGHSESALVDGDLVFWTAGGAEHNVVALNRFTGDLVWSNPGFGERSGYNPPKLIELPSRKILVTFSAYHLMGFDISDGTMLWSHEQDNLPPEKRTLGMGDTHSNTVIFDEGSIYYAAGDGNGGVKLNLSADGSEITEVWRNTGFDSYMGGIVKIGDYLYGSGTAKPELRAIGAYTGVLTDSLRLGSGAIIAADNMLYYYSQRGEISLLKFEHGKMEKVSSFRITKGTKEHFSHPVINKGVLYQRHGNVLMAFDIRQK